MVEKNEIDVQCSNDVPTSFCDAMDKLSKKLTLLEGNGKERNHDDKIKERIENAEKRVKAKYPPDDSIAIKFSKDGILLKMIRSIHSHAHIDTQSRAQRDTPIDLDEDLPE